MRARAWGTTGILLALVGCNSQSGEPVPGPTGLEPAGAAVVASASGGYHFTTDPSFFGFPVDNRLTFNAQEDADGNVSGRFNYEQSFVFDGQTFEFDFRGRVTCFEIYDTPVLQHYEDIPPMSQNRAKWGGLIEFSNDADFPAGGFIWFQSIDNGEGSNAPPDLSTISGFGDEAGNEAFCASDAVPNPNFGPHPVQGNIQVR